MKNTESTDFLAEFPSNSRESGHLSKAFRELENEKLDRMLAAHHIDRHAPKLAVVSYKKWIWAAAASIVLLISVAIFMNQPSISPLDFANAQTGIAANDYNPALRSMRDTGILQSALRAFSSKDWELADRQFSTALVVTPPGQTGTLEYIYFYKGLTMMQLGQHAQAAGIFEKAIQFGAGNYEKDARWLRALALIQSGNQQAAILELEKIVADTTWNKAKDARKLLKLLQ